MPVPPLLDGWPRNEPLKAVVVIGAAGCCANRVVGVLLDPDVPSFRMEHTVHQLALAHHAGTHAGPNGQIQNVVEALAASKRAFSQTGNVYVGVVSAWHAQGVPQRAEHVEVTPRNLGRVQDVAVLAGFGVNARGAERANAQRGYAAALEPANDLLDGFCRRGGGEFRALKNGSVGIARCADHLGPARLQGAQQLATRCLVVHVPSF